MSPQRPVDDLAERRSLLAGDAFCGPEKLILKNEGGSHTLIHIDAFGRTVKQRSWKAKTRRAEKLHEEGGESCGAEVPVGAGGFADTEFLHAGKAGAIGE